MLGRDAIFDKVSILKTQCLSGDYMKQRGYPRKIKGKVLQAEI